MCRSLFQAICSQIRSFAGNHAGSQALIIESSLLLLLSVFSRGNQKHYRNMTSALTGNFFSNSLWINFDLLRTCEINLIKVETKIKIYVLKIFSKVYDMVVYRNLQGSTGYISSMFRINMAFYFNFFWPSSCYSHLTFQEHTRDETRP